MRETKAVGRRCTNAVAMRTPVPKCRDRKINRCGIGSLGKRLAMIGNEHASRYQYSFFSGISIALPSVLKVRIRNRAATCKDVL